MDMRGTHRPGLEFGALSKVASFVGAFAILGFVLLGDGPETMTDTLPAAPNPATSQAGSDPSVPSASSVFGNRSEEPGPQVETF